MSLCVYRWFISRCAGVVRGFCQDHLDVTHLDNVAVQVLDECQAALGWLEEKQNLQNSMKKTEDPVLVTADIKKKEETLSRVADPILTKPPPKPKVIATAAPLWSHVCKPTKPVIECL